MQLTLAACLFACRASGEDVKDALVYGLDSMKSEEGRRMAKIRSLLGLQDGSTSAPPLDDIPMPESLLREDDVSYENMKASVEKCFALPSFEGDGYVVHRFLFLLDSKDILQDVKKHLRSIIQSMSCTGLLRFANIVTGGSVSYEKTRFKMRKIILEYLKEILQNPKHKNRKRFIEELPKLLKNPSNFHITSHVQVVDPAYFSHHSAARKILEGLEEMSFQLLSAMSRRLKGEVKEPKFGDKLKYKQKPNLITQVRNELCKVRAGEELPIGLAKAMSVAVLGLRMKLDNPEIFIPELCGSNAYRPIHGDLLKCIGILNGTKLKNLVDDTVEKLRTILDPINDSKVKPQQFQDALKRWLIEHLFEYSELAKTPDSVVKTVKIIKQMHHERAICNKNEQAKKEVEIVGDLSAQYKQIMLDKICDHNIDDDYNDAYFKDIEVNSYDEYDNLLKYGGNHSDESVGECEADGSVLPESTSGENAFTLEDVGQDGAGEEQKHVNKYLTIQAVLPESTSGENAFTLENVGQDSSDGAGEEQKHVNKYLTIQEICDERSLGAHSLIGRLLEKLLDEEGAELDESKRLYLRRGRSDHQEECAGSLHKKRKKKKKIVQVPNSNLYHMYQKMRASDYKRKEVNALRRAPYK
ncbi:hypothetical protein C5167_021780 [Papaver somniferum]|uniref:Uncharacterized protein n=1 Tax=Papaver somniferum TaxID=3469 RepID=A0A4Y7JJ34_PAPSO|nr:hypothetical protein C5167_021780 [Papaver somniferum]